MSEKSSQSRLAERLIILLDFTTGLLNRVYHSVRYSYGPLVGCLKSEVIKHLSSKVDDPTEGIEGVNGYEVIRKQRREILAETKLIYETFVDFCNAKGECERLFSTLSQKIVKFNLHTNIDLTTRFLSVFSDYVRLHLLLQRIKEVRVAVYCHMIAYFEENQTDVDYSHEVKELLVSIREPIMFLQKGFRGTHDEGVGKSLHEALKSIKSAYQTWTNYEIVKQRNLFNLIFTNDKAKRDRIAEPMDLDEFSFFYDSSHIDKIGSWIFCLYVVFPELLGAKASGEASDLLMLAFNNRQVIVLVRDETVDMLDIYSNLQKYSLPAIKVPSKKLYRNILRKSDAKTICNNHYQMRHYLNSELRSLTQLVETVPGIIPAKLPVLMSIIALSRYEVLWVFHHCAAQSKNKVKKVLESEKGANPKDGIPHTYATLPEIMWQIHNLAEIVKKSIPLTRMYYSELLSKGLSDLSVHCNLMKTGGYVDSYVISHMEYIIRRLEDIKTDPEKKRNLEGLRLNWYRASVLLSGYSGGGRIEKEKEMSKILVAKMNMVVEHTRYYDKLDKEIDNRSSFSELSVFRAQCADIFNILLSGRFDQCRHWSVFLNIWEQGMRIVHNQMYHEYRDVGGKVFKKAGDYIAGAVSIIESAIQRENGILENYEKLRLQYNPEHVLRREMQGLGKKLEDRPGMESLFGAQTEDIKPFSQFKRRLQEAAKGFTEVDSIIVYNKRLFPNAYLYDALRDFFRIQMRKLLEKDEYNIVRPTEYLARLQNLFNCISDIDSVVSINLTKMTRELMYWQMHDSFVGSLGTAVGVPEDKDLKPTKTSQAKLIHTIMKYYMHFLHNSMQRMVYSPIYGGFCDVVVNKSQTQAEDYFSPSELTALCRIIGPQGVRVIDTECHKKASRQLHKIVEIYEENEKLLKTVDIENFYGIAKWQAVVSRIKHYDDLVSIAIGLGSILLFRKNLRDALMRVMKDEVRFEANSVGLLHERFLKSGTENGRFNDLSLDFGILSKFSDSMLRRMAVDAVPDGDHDGQIWRLYTPIMMGTCFVSEKWRGTRFICGFGALLNNGFAMAESIHFIMSVFARSEVERVHLLEKYLKVASSSLFYMNSGKMKNKYSGWSVPDLLTYLDYFVTSSKDLESSALDKCSISCAVIRSQYIATYGEMTAMSSDAQIGAEDDEDDIKGEEKEGESKRQE